MKQDNLIALLKNKNVGAFSFLYDKYSPALFGIILKAVKDENIACKLLEETFITIWKEIPEYENKTSLFTWMYWIADEKLKFNGYINAEIKLCL